MSNTKLVDLDGDTRVEFVATQDFNIRTEDSAELLLPGDYYKAIQFLAHSWWRRMLIKFISGGRIEFRK